MGGSPLGRPDNPPLRLILSDKGGRAWVSQCAAYRSNSQTSANAPQRTFLPKPTLVFKLPSVALVFDRRLGRMPGFPHIVWSVSGGRRASAAEI